MRYPAQRTVPRIGQPRRELRHRKAQYQHVPGGAMLALQSFGKRHQSGVAFTKHDLASALSDEKRTSRIDDQPQIFGRIVARARPQVARALQPAE